MWLYFLVFIRLFVCLTFKKNYFQISDIMSMQRTAGHNYVWWWSCFQYWLSGSYRCHTVVLVAYYITEKSVILLGEWAGILHLTGNADLPTVSSCRWVSYIQVVIRPARLPVRWNTWCQCCISVCVACCCCTYSVWTVLTNATVRTVNSALIQQLL